MALKDIEVNIKSKTYNSITFEWNLINEITLNPYFLLDIFNKTENWKTIYT